MAGAPRPACEIVIHGSCRRTRKRLSCRCRVLDTIVARAHLGRIRVSAEPKKGGLFQRLRCLVARVARIAVLMRPPSCLASDRWRPLVGQSTPTALIMAHNVVPSSNKGANELCPHETAAPRPRQAAPGR